MSFSLTPPVFFGVSSQNKARDLGKFYTYYHRAMTTNNAQTAHDYFCRANMSIPDSQKAHMQTQPEYRHSKLRVALWGLAANLPEYAQFQIKAGLSNWPDDPGFTLLNRLVNIMFPGEPKTAFQLEDIGN